MNCMHQLYKNPTRTPILLALSATSLSALCMNGSSVIWGTLNLISTFGLTVFVARKYRAALCPPISGHPHRTIFAVLYAFCLALFFSATFYSRFIEYLSKHDRLPSEQHTVWILYGVIGAGLAAYYALLFIVSHVCSRISVSSLAERLQQFYRENAPVCRFYTIWGAILLALFFYLGTLTNAFVYPLPFDSGELSNNHIFGADMGASPIRILYNDSPRHILFSKVMLPLTMPLALISGISAIVFQLPFLFCFTILYTILQVFLTVGIGLLIYFAFCSVLDRRSAFVGSFLFSVTFPTLLFAFTLERFTPELFVLLLFVCTVLYGKSLRLRYGLLALNALMLNTSAVAWLFLLWKKEQPISYHLHYAARVIAILALSIVACGGFSNLMHIPSDSASSMKSYAIHDYGLPVAPPLHQFFAFQSGFVVAPAWEARTLETGNFLGVEQPFSIPPFATALGGLTFVAVVFAYWRNRHLLLAKICATWIVFSFLLLGCAGLGSNGNEMYLYASYFSWASFLLLYCELAQSCRRHPIAFCRIVCLLGIWLGYANILTLDAMATVLSESFPPLF